MSTNENWFLMHAQLELKQVMFIRKKLVHFLLNPTTWGDNPKSKGLKPNPKTLTFQPISL